MKKDIRQTYRKLNQDVAFFAMQQVGLSAFECAEFINEIFSKCSAYSCEFFDTTSEDYGNSNDYAVYLDGAWLVVEDKE